MSKIIRTVIIIGPTHAHICDIPRSEGRRFVQFRGGLYKVYPASFRRMRLIDADGQETGSEDVVIYREGEIVPYMPGDVDYSMDRTLAEIDEHKLMHPGGSWSRPFFRIAAQTWNGIMPFMPWIIVGVILVYAFLG